MRVLEAKNLKRKCNATSKKAVRCVNTGVVYASCSDAADILSLEGVLIDPRNILFVCQGIRKKTGGLKWEYADNDLMDNNR